MNPFARLALCLAPLVSLACAPESARAPGARPRIAVVPKGTTHVFWQTVEKGARVGEKEANVEVVFKGPLQENDRSQQIALVQQFLGEGIDALCLAPLDHTALAPVVAQAKAQKVPVVIFDSALDGVAGQDFASFVATNNTAGGRLAGEHLVKLLGGKGKVVMLRYNVGSASTEERETGFLAAAKTGGLEVTVDNRYAGATLGEAKTSALNLLDALREAQGVFCSNESATNGMLLALEQMDLAGKLRFVGFDASPPLVAGLEAGKIDALVVQDPKRMGQLAVSTAAAALRGEHVPPAIDTGAVLVTRENRAEPSVAALLE